MRYKRLWGLGIERFFFKFLLGLHLECMIVASHDLVQEDLLPHPHLKLECLEGVGYTAAKYEKDSTQHLLSLLCHNCWIF
jgi:hypothetical protein